MLNDCQKCLEYSEVVLTLHNKIPDFASKLLMLDEAHLGLNGTVNKQNYKFWGIVNLRQTYSKPLHPHFMVQSINPIQHWTILF